MFYMDGKLRESGSIMAGAGQSSRNGEWSRKQRCLGSDGNEGFCCSQPTPIKMVTGKMSVIVWKHLALIHGATNAAAATDKREESK